MANLLAGGAAWCGFEQDCDALGAVCCWGGGEELGVW